MVIFQERLLREVHSPFVYIDSKETDLRNSIGMHFVHFAEARRARVWRMLGHVLAIPRAYIQTSAA